MMICTGGGVGVTFEKLASVKQFFVFFVPK